MQTLGLKRHLTEIASLRKGDQLTRAIEAPARERGNPPRLVKDGRVVVAKPIPKYLRNVPHRRPQELAPIHTFMPSDVDDMIYGLCGDLRFSHAKPEEVDSLEAYWLQGTARH